MTNPRCRAWVPGFLLFLAVSGLVLVGIGILYRADEQRHHRGDFGLGRRGRFCDRAGLQAPRRGRGRRGSLRRTNRHSSRKKQRSQELRTAIKNLTPEAWAVTVGEEELANDPAETILAAKLSERLTELGRLENQKRRLWSRKRRLSRMRKAMQTRQRDVAQARQAWCDVLKQCGLGETVQVEEAVGLWQKIAEAKEQMRAWDAAREAAGDVMERYESFCHLMADLGQRTGHPHLDYNQPLAVLDVWEEDVKTLGEESEEQLVLKAGNTRPPPRNPPPSKANHQSPHGSRGPLGPGGGQEPQGI